MKISYDKTADAVYIRAKAARIKRTQRIQGNLLVDFDARGEVRGVEILHASRWPSSGSKVLSVEIGKRKIQIPAFA